MSPEKNRDRNETCTATVLVHDDRWGGWTNRCELPAGHQGPHQHALTACDPVAFMVWTGGEDGPL